MNTPAAGLADADLTPSVAVLAHRDYGLVGTSVGLMLPPEFTGGLSTAEAAKLLGVERA